MAEGALAGRNILITGAGRGIGAATARAAARAGATVILLDKNVADLESVYDTIEASGGPQPAIYPMNLLGAQAEDYEALGERLADAFGSLHGLVHCAAELGRPAQLDHYRSDAWFKAMHVNLNAPFLVTQQCLPLLRAGADGAVVFVSDAGGRHGKAYQGAYGVSKFGLEGLMQILAAELADTTRLRAYSVDPGPTRTTLRREAYPAEDSDRLTDPEATGTPIASLLSPGCPFPSGSRITLT
ncbi:SDR family NAD(P)-dependent oxidoreductase [Ectothiorhodospiraceae bacterium WFHF3C12]|nr:SDR family NAD(P)-dependent oxidoreductase [Ectothiorhodospiraceae bacterium WFHF3C12]